MKTLTIEDLEKAAGALARSDRGRQALRDLRSFLTNGATELGGENIAHVVTLLSGAWNGFSASTPTVIGCALGNSWKSACQHFEVIDPQSGLIVGGGRRS